MPFLAVFPAATEISNHEHAPAIQPGPHGGTKMRRQADVKTTIARQQSWRRAIELQSFAPNDAHRNLCAVLRHCPLTNDFRVVEIHWQSFEQSRARSLTC